MNRLEKNIEIIHDLLQIQHERATTYEKLMQFGNYDEKTTAILKRLAKQSRNCMLELRGHITDTTGSDPADRVEIKGDILRGWNGLIHFLPDSPFPEIMASFEENEMRTNEAYQLALSKSDMLCKEVRNLIRNQLELVWRSFIYIQESREKPFVPESTPVTDERKPPSFYQERLYAEV